MADITWTVELLFQVTGRFYNFFILDTSQLDGAATLAAADGTWVDITSYVDAASITRGRSRDLDGFRAGHCTVALDDPDRTFDPTNTGSPYWGNILPGQPIRITATLSGTDHRLFYGYVNAWPANYGSGFLPRVQIVADDALAVLAEQDLDEIASSHDGDLSGERVARILDLPEVDWDTELRDIDTGLTALGPTTLGSNALTELQKIARSELGALFIARDGTLTFRERWATAPTAAVTFSDDGDAGAAHYEPGLSQDFSLDLVANRVQVAGTSGTVQTATDSVSQEAYRIRPLNRTDLLMQSDAEASDQADFLLARFRDPELRFDTIDVRADEQTDARKAELLGLELSDRIQVEFTPPGSGTPNQIVRAAAVDGLKWTLADIRTSLTVTMSAGSKVFPFVLDDAQLGELDGDTVLAY